MKDKTVYLIYNTNATIQNNIRASTKIKIHNKKLRERPRSAGEVLIQPKIRTEVHNMVKRSISLSMFEDFFLKRRIPLIKPLISEREILKLQLLQAQCKRKAQQRLWSIQSGVERDETYLIDRAVEDEDVFEYKGKGIHEDNVEEKSKKRPRHVTTPLSSTTVKKEDAKKQGDKIIKESEEGKRIKSPTSSKSKQETKKLKDHGKSKIGPEKQKKKVKEGTSLKEKLGMSMKEKTKSEKAYEDESKAAKRKEKRSNENELKSNKSDEKSERQRKGSKTKEKIKSGEEKSLTNVVYDKSGSKGSSQKSSKQKIEARQSKVDSTCKRSRDRSKDKLSLGNKSDRSNKSGSSKSRKKSDSTIKRNDKDNRDQDVKSKDKNNSETENSQDRKQLSDMSKPDKKTKQGSASETTFHRLAKDKTSKINAEGKYKTSGKTVKFSNAFGHVIHYVLSNPVFVKLGWTLAPTDRAQLQIVTFRTTPSSPHTYCFRERTEDETKYYSVSLEKIAFNFRVDGTGEIFYPSGSQAATLTKHNTGMRLTLYSEPKNDPLVRGSNDTKVLGIFDSSGNGVVYNIEGTKLLNFNQLEGIFYSPHMKSSYKWQWCDYKVIEAQRVKALLRHIAKEQREPMQPKKSTPATGVFPKKPKSEEKKEIDDEYEKILAELPYPVAQKTKTKINHIWGFKPITLKINNEMRLRINGQDNVSISFSSNQISLRIDLGVKVDPDVVERVEALAPKKVSDIPCVFDSLLDLSPSLQQLTSSFKPTSKLKRSII